MTCTLSLAACGSFALGLPSGRKLLIPNTPAATAYLYKLLYDAQQGESRRGYIGVFPTQAILDKWVMENAEKRREELEAKLGVSLDELEIDL